MIYEQLRRNINSQNFQESRDWIIAYWALREVVKLHKPQEITLPNGKWGENCEHCNIGFTYPCPTIEAIDKELSS